MPGNAVGTDLHCAREPPETPCRSGAGSGHEKNRRRARPKAAGLSAITPGPARRPLGDAGQNVSVITVIDGAKGWLNVNGTTQDLDPKLLKSIKEDLHRASVLQLVPLKDGKKYEVTAVGEVKVNDRPAVGIRVASKDRKDI